MNASRSTVRQPSALSRTVRGQWLAALALIGLVFVAYSQVVHFDFIWDDEAHLTQNPCVTGPLGLKEIWTTTRAVYYPLVLTTFWALHKIVGLAPWPYHALNVVIHAISAVLLWRVLRQLNVTGAWLAAALWALHPVLVQSVAWVTELKNTQSGLFYLLSILCFLKFDAQERERGRWWRWSLALLFFIFAIFSKPSTVMLPVALALCLWWRKGRIRPADLASIVPFALVSAAASAWTIWEQKFHAGAIGAEWSQTPLERLIIAGRAVWFYAGKLSWPHPLIFIYPRWLIDSKQVAAYLPLAAVFAGLAILLSISGTWRRPVLFAVLYFVTALFPVLGFFNVYFFRYSFVSDHFQYLASMAPLALAGAAISVTIDRLRWKSVLRPAFGGAILVVLGVLTWRQTSMYRDLVTLYTKTLAENPQCWMAHYNLGIVLRGRGETEQAISHYRAAIALRPDYAEAHYNLARLLADKGDSDDAIAHYEKALLVNPADAEAHNNLGAALFESGRLTEAIGHYERALDIRPNHPGASLNLANALLFKGDIDGAIVHYLAGLASSPDQPDAQYNVANALLRKGRTDEAIVHYKKAIELMPQNADAHANLGSALLQKSQIAAAIAEYRSALAIAPQNRPAQTNLAWLLSTASDPLLRNGREAVTLAEEVNRFSGNNQPVVLRILAAAYAEAGQFSEAVDTAERALQLQDSEPLAGALRKEIALYRSGSPYHKEPPASSAR
jgi:tetratricopeptide (TPR) repeat protein